MVFCYGSLSKLRQVPSAVFLQRKMIFVEWMNKWMNERMKISRNQSTVWDNDSIQNDCRSKEHLARLSHLNFGEMWVSEKESNENTPWFSIKS